MVSTYYVAYQYCHVTNTIIMHYNYKNNTFGDIYDKGRKKSVLSNNLSVVDKLGELYGIDDVLALVDSHIARCDLIDENDLSVVVAKLKLDIP